MENKEKIRLEKDRISIQKLLQPIFKTKLELNDLTMTRMHSGTNYIYKVIVFKDSLSEVRYAVRIYGKSAELITNRERELNIVEAL